MFACWKIDVVGDCGSLKEHVVSGIYFENAIADAGFRPEQVVRAQRYWNLRSFGSDTSSKNQLIFLMKLLPYYLANTPVRSENVFRTFVPIQKLIRNCPQAINANQSLSERLSMLHFNPAVLTILRAGERSGNLGQALEQAVAYLHRELEVNRGVNKGILGGLLLFAVSFIVLLGVALLSSGAVEAIIAAGIIQERNFSGSLLYLLNQYTRYYLWTLPLIAIALVVGIQRYYPQLNHFWPLSVFKDYLNILRSVRLVSAWLILEKAGLNLEQDEQLLGGAVGRSLAGDICQQRNEGETFSDLLTREYFSPTLEECCQGIASLNTASRINTLKQLSKLLDIEREQYANKIARSFYITGVAIALGAIVLILSGVLFPIYAAGLGGIRL